MATLVITPEIEADAMRLAEATGQTPTEAVADALRSKLKLFRLPSKRKIDLDAVYALLESDKSPIDYSLTEDEILGYDEFGVPEQPYLNDRR